MWRTSFFVLSMALVLLGAEVAHADPELLGDRSPPHSVQLDYVPDPAVRRNCAPAETLAMGLSLEAKREVVDPNATARLIVKLTRKGAVYTAMVEMRDEQGGTIYTNPFGPVHSCDMLLIDIEVGVGYLFRRADQEAAAEKAAAEKAAAEKAAAERAAADKTTVEKVAAEKAAEKAAAAKSAADKDRIAAKPRRPGGWAWRVAASGGVGFLMAPSDVAAVVRLEGGLQWPLAPKWQASVSVGGLFSPRASKTAPVSQTKEVDIGTLVGAAVLAPCAHRDIGFGWVFGCVGLELGALRADGGNIRQPASAVMFWGAVDPRLGAEVPFPYVPWLAAQLIGDVPVLFQRPTAHVTLGPPMSTAATADVWQAPRAAPSVSLGLRALF